MCCAPRAAVRGAKAGHRHGDATHRSNAFGYRALDFVFQYCFACPFRVSIDQQVIDMPVQISLFLQGQAFVTRDSSGNASARASDIGVAPGGENARAQ